MILLKADIIRIDKLFYAFIILFSISCKKGSDTSQTISTYKFINKIKIDQATFKNNLIYLTIPIENDTITFFTDTGGGRFVYPEIARLDNLKIDSTYEQSELIESIDLENLFLEQNIPKPNSPYSVYRGQKSRKEFNAGMLGSFWFGNRCWELNYKEKALYSLDSIFWPKNENNNSVPLGFQENESGIVTTHFPSIEMIVQGDTIPVLFDSGATINPSSDATEYFSNEEAVGGSFIIASIFDKWKSENPEWPVIKSGDSSVDNDLIQVPKMTIGNHTVGPVWFAKRADNNFTEWMSQWMDVTIEGAIGGSCFKHFDSIILDYPNQRVLFLR